MALTECLYKCIRHSWGHIWAENSQSNQNIQPVATQCVLCQCVVNDPPCKYYLISCSPLVGSFPLYYGYERGILNLANQCVLYYLHYRSVWYFHLGTALIAAAVITQVSVLQGALDCWVFLSCLEVLHRIEGCCDRTQLEANFSHTVGLWTYATEKVHTSHILFHADCELKENLNSFPLTLRELINKTSVHTRWLSV